jgi:hypothetical protein
MKDPAHVLSNAGALVQAGAAFLGVVAFLLAEIVGAWGMWQVPKTRWIELGVGVGGAAGLGLLVVYGVPS